MASFCALRQTVIYKNLMGVSSTLPQATRGLIKLLLDICSFFTSNGTQMHAKLTAHYVNRLTRKVISKNADSQPLNGELSKMGVITPRIFWTLKMLLLTVTTFARILIDVTKPGLSQTWKHSSTYKNGCFRSCIVTLSRLISKQAI